MGASLLEEQISYYRARAPEYDQWFLRQGRYDLGPERNRGWHSEVEEVRAALSRFQPSGEVLELACGTGWWTRELARYADRITAVDASPEALEINRNKVNSSGIRYIRADLFEWTPDHRYDVVFFGFWLSHVPPARFESFWDLVYSSLRPGGRVFFVDSLPAPAGLSTSEDRRPGHPEYPISVRQLNDGREFRIFKVFYQPAELEERLNDLGWRISVHATENRFLYGASC